MEQQTQANFQVCQQCGADPRASLVCKKCETAGLVAQSPDGYLFWKPKLDRSFFVMRSFRRKANAVIHILLALLVLLGLAYFGFRSFDAFSSGDIYTSTFWFSGALAVSVFWFSVFLGCFAYFRIVKFSDRVEALPGWGKTQVQIEAMQKKAEQMKELRDISVYFQEPVFELLETAYTLAQKSNLTEIQPVHLFAAALSTTAGGIFFSRLGLKFEQIKQPLANLVSEGQAGSPTHLSMKAKEVLLKAYLQARQANRRHVGTIEVFLEAFEADQRLQDMLDAAGYTTTDVRHVGEWIRIQESLKEEHDRFVKLASLKPASVMNRTMTARQTPLLDKFSQDLTILARKGYIAPLVGRKREMDELLRAIESGRRSVCLVGETGVGKNALVEGLARRMVEEDVPQELFDRRLVSLSVAQLLSAGDPALASQRLLGMLQELALSGNVILVIEGIEALAGTSSGAPMDVAETLASELDKGYFIVIGTTTPQNWTEYLERRSLGSRLIKVNVPEVEPDEAIRILMAKAGSIEYQNKVFFSYAAIEKTVNLAGRYLRELKLPESALNIIQEAAVLTKRQKGEHALVSAEDVASVIHDKTNIPVEAVTKDESSKLMNLEDKLHERIIGQNEAVKAVAQAMRRARAEIREGKRPIANFLFLGPTGVGKTELSKAIAAEYFGDEKRMVRMDMSEYQSPDSVSRMIGAPGDPRGGLLTEAVRKNPFSIVLLDELEKAHPDILTLFLQVMDDGRLTDGVGRTIDFTNTLLIATSNAGSQYIQDEVRAGSSIERIKTGLLEDQLKGHFRPEFLNRFDAIIVFRPLDMEDVVQIAWLLLDGVRRRLEEKGIGFRAEDAAVEELAKAGFDPVYGARPLRRVIQDRVENALADLLLQQGVGRKDTVVLVPGGELKVEKYQR